MSQVLNKMAGRTARTWNDAVSNATTGFVRLGTCLDYWTKAGTYTNRAQTVVNTDMARIFADDEKTALAILFGLRLITRKPNLEGFEEAQTGYGRKDEFYKAVVWLHENKPDYLYKNLHLIPVFGCWKDLVTEPLISVLDRQKVYQLFKENLDDQLVRKYLPCAQRTKKNDRTERDKKRTLWAKGFMKFLGLSSREYRKMKSVGRAHIWQKQMGAREWDKINFNGIPGKAMLLHTSRKGKDKQTVFERHNLVERLKEWVLKQPTVKFKGYPYELTKAASVHKNPSLVQKLVYNRQFEALIEPMRKHSLGNTLCALDTSGSMTSQVVPNVSAFDICVSMGLVFSSLNVGYFKDAVVAFDNVSRMIKLAGDFVDRLHHVERMETAWGSTNFQSVIDLLVTIRKQNPAIPLSEYPETLLVISDMQFNPAGSNTKTNYEVAMQKLRKVGLQDMRIIWWFVNGAGTDFPSKMDDKGTYLIGGFDPVNLKALLGLTAEKKDFITAEKKEETPLDGMLNFLAQPIFSLLKM